MSDLSGFGGVAVRSQQLLKSVIRNPKFTFTMSEFEQRRGALAAQLAPLKADAALISFLPNVRYLTGYTGSSGLLLLLSSGEATFFTDPRYRIQAAAEVNCVVKVSSGQMLPDVVALAARRKVRRLGFEKSRIGYEQYELLK